MYIVGLFLYYNSALFFVEYNPKFLVLNSALIEFQNNFSEVLHFICWQYETHTWQI